MSREENNTQSEISCGCVTKFINPCINLYNYFNVGSSVHPINTIAPQHSEFFIISPNKKLRVIHIKPDTINTINKQVNERNTVLSRRLSEDYWFTRWSKPLKLNRCSCSFRKSRHSVTTDQLTTNKNFQRKSNFEYNINDKSNYVGSSRKKLLIETFVEQLVQETFYEVIAEFFVKDKSKTNNGFINFTFETCENDDDGVVLRQKPSQIKYESYQSITVQNKNTDKNCTHQKSSTNNIVIMLLHGIGSTADVWWIIIKNLLCKGFEIIAPDLLGHGYSSAPDKPNAYTFESFVNNAISIFDHYIGSDENKKCIMIGHSFGCSLATAVYRYRAQQIIQLILISGGGPTPLASPRQHTDIPLFGCLHTLIKPFLFCGLKRSFFYSNRGKHFDVCEQDNAIPNHILQYILNKQNWPEGDAAFHRRILIPTLLVYGLQDTHITLVQECEMERTIPRAFLELIPNAGHMPMLETPDYLCHMILCFIEWWRR